jgi:hypothetical protein
MCATFDEFRWNRRAMPKGSEQWRRCAEWVDEIATQEMVPYDEDDAVRLAGFCPSEIPRSLILTREHSTRMRPARVACNVAESSRRRLRPAHPKSWLVHRAPPVLHFQILEFNFSAKAGNRDCWRRKRRRSSSLRLQNGAVSRSGARARCEALRGGLDARRMRAWSAPFQSRVRRYLHARCSRLSPIHGPAARAA